VRQRNNNQESEPDAIAYIPHVLNVTMPRGATIIARAKTVNTAQAGYEKGRLQARAGFTQPSPKSRVQSLSVTLDFGLGTLDFPPSPD
jgi:hypothetical protein